MQDRTYWIETWGCQMNEHDSEKMSGALEGLGFARSESLEAADLVLLNTCAIREKAEERVHQALGEIAPLKRRRPELIVGVCGCVAQLSGQTLLEKAPWLDLVLGPRAAIRLPEHLAQLTDRRGIVDTTLYQESILAGTESVRRSPTRTKAFVTVMEGCNKTCSYCVVPITRGREDSRALDVLLSEVWRLAGEGYREIEFLGQNVNAWRCPQTYARLGDLLRAAARVPGIARLRFMTSHPLHLSDEIIAAMADTPEVCPAIHLPVQSGSDRILRAMRRGYDRAKYLDRVARLRSAIPGIAISTDFIVGFPGETAAEFRESLELMREVEFDSMFSFIYSERPGTLAAMMPDRLSLEEKSARLSELQALQRSIQERLHSALIGTTALVLIEGPSRKRVDEWSGRLASGKVVNFADLAAARGEIVPVRIVAATSASFRGERVVPAPSHSGAA